MLDFEGLAVDEGQVTPSVPAASLTPLGAVVAVTPGTDLRLSASRGAQCGGYRCVRIAVIGDVHPQLAYNRYMDSDVHPPGKIRFDVEAKYLRCKGINLICFLISWRRSLLKTRIG